MGTTRGFSASWSPPCWLITGYCTQSSSKTTTHTHNNMASAGAQAIPSRPGTEAELPNIQDLAVTPGGLHFLGTTPGGTRIIYDRNTLMQYRRSPLAKTPPADFPAIPGVTAPGVQESTIPEGDEGEEDPPSPTGPPPAEGEDDVFPMD